MRSNAPWVMVTWDPSLLNRQNDRHIRLKTLPSATSVAGGTTACVGDDGDSFHDDLSGRIGFVRLRNVRLYFSVIMTGLIQNTVRVITVITRN